jgi:chromate transporter
MMSRPSLLDIVLYFLKLGLTGFGGPVALANAMRRDLVEGRGWLGADEYDEGLAIATACPGPLAYQLGVYCGFLTHGVIGALCVAVAFAAAPFAIVVGVAALYVRFGSSWILKGLFYGVGPVVIALIVRSCWDLGKKTLRNEWLAYTFAVVACAITIVLQQELTVLFLAAGALGIVLFYKPAPQVNASAAASTNAARSDVKLSSVAPIVAGVYQTVALPKIFWFFFKTGFLVFGSGLVIVPFLKTYIVDQYHWISNEAFLDAVAVGIISPGPVVITATFVGYLNHQLSGALAATAGIFAPSLIFVLVGTPILRKYRRNGRVQGFIRGITVAVVGVLVGTSFLVARSSIHDWLSLAILVAALAAIWSKWKIPEQSLVGAGALVGLAVFFFART